MLLTISTTHRPATDLGFLLHKHPDRVQRFSVPFGDVHVFYPEAGKDRCTAALLLDVDPGGSWRSDPGRGACADRGHLAQGDAAGALTVAIGELDAAGPVRANARPAGTSWPRDLLELAPTIARELRAVSQVGTSLERYATISAPVLVLLGTASPACEQQVCNRLAEVLPGGRLALLPDCGHVAHAHAPDDVATALARFLDPRRSFLTRPALFEQSFGK